MYKKWLREPLLHFLLIGVALFVIYGLQNDGLVNHDNRIVISEADVNRLITLWGKKRQRPPTQAELNGLIEQQIREEVLYREALSMGLDQNDSIVRRRLAQKVEFISADLSAQIEPSETDLVNHLAANPELFEIPARISFVQVYLNADRRGKSLQKDADRLLTKLKKRGAKANNALGDPFMFGHEHGQLTPRGVSRLFGEEFTSSLFSLPIGKWQGPVQSGYGLHLVRIDNKTEASQPVLDEVKEKVRTEWFAQQRRKMDKLFYESLRQRYDIVIESAKVAIAGSKPDTDGRN